MSKEYQPFGLGLGADQLPKTKQAAEDLWDQLKPMWEEMNNPKEANGVNKAIEEAKALGFVPGAEVTLNSDDEVGRVVGYNEAVGGFYSGSRYPIIVEFERGTYEYSLTDLVLSK